MILRFVIARPERPWQSLVFEGVEIAASAFGLLAMTTIYSVLTSGYIFKSNETGKRDVFFPVFLWFSQNIGKFS